MWPTYRQMSIKGVLIWERTETVKGTRPLKVSNKTPKVGWRKNYSEEGTLAHEKLQLHGREIVRTQKWKRGFKVRVVPRSKWLLLRGELGGGTLSYCTKGVMIQEILESK